jgi:2-amino-4-hydroxy-6-hydroxymethyldihydropteridine diphosphokinase
VTQQSTILIGLGANLPSRRFGPPHKTLEAALVALEGHGVQVVSRSRWYSTAALPLSDQPRYLNAVVAVETELSPEKLLELLHAIEHDFGRNRSVANAARGIDLDLLAYGNVIRTQKSPILPHPRLAERAFVLRPLCDIDPAWCHPQLGKSALELAETVSAGADVQLWDDPDRSDLTLS